MGSSRSFQPSSLVTELPYKSQADKNASNRRGRERDPGKYREYHRAWYARNKERLKAERAAKSPGAYRPRLTAEDKRERFRERRRATRLKAIERMGGACERCGIDDERVLQFDHRVPLLRRTNGVDQDGLSTAYAILRRPDPEKVFALLCANCHVIKTRTDMASAAVPTSRQEGYQQCLF